MVNRSLTQSLAGNIAKAASYIFGLFLISLGINLSKLSALGISAVSSIPRVCELITGITLGTASIMVFVALVAVQLIILRKKFRAVNILGVLVAILFGYMVDFTGTDPNAFGHLLLNFPRPHGYAMRLMYSVLSTVIVGIGVFFYTRPKWVLMPPDGVSAALSEVTGKTFGDCKSIVDTTMIVCAAILQFAFLGGFSSFVGANTALREGTLIVALFAGQIMKLCVRFADRVNNNESPEIAEPD